MYYPLNLQLKRADIFPLFGTQLDGVPHVFDFSSTNPVTFKYDTADFVTFQKSIFDELAENNCDWGIGKYMEERSGILRNYDLMISEGRIYHMGLDIIVAEGLSLFAPLDAQVFHVGREEELGSYGGHIILKHEVLGVVFYSMYGHLNSNFIVQKGQQLPAGEKFALIGADKDSGGWFTHTHLQILTQRAVEEGRAFQGYVSKDDLPYIEEIFPSPYFLFTLG